MQLKQTYNTDFFNISVTTNNHFIADSIKSYFSIYDNISFNKKPVFYIKFDISVIKKLKKMITDEVSANKKNSAEYIVKSHNGRFPVKERFRIFETGKKKVFVNFYNGFCSMNIDFNDKNDIKANCEVDRPERCGLDFFPNFIILAALEIIFKYYGLFFIHSSLVSNEKFGILIPGSSGSGKTTLAFYLSSIGFKLITDDKSFCGIEKNNAVCRGILQPTDIIKKKDTFLIKSGFAEKIIQQHEDNGRLIIIKKFNPEYIDDKTQVRLILFPEIGDKFKARILSKNDALIRLFRTSVTPGFSINLKKHFHILNNLVENSETYSIVLTKDYSFFYKFLKKRFLEKL